MLKIWTEMAENKKSFVGYADWNKTFEKLSDDEAGKLAKMIFAYVNDENPKPPDRITELIFEPFKNQLKRDLEKYEEVKKKRSEAGRNGGFKSGVSRSNPKQNEANEANASIVEPKEANASFAKKNEANEAVTVNDTVNVNDNDNVILLGKETKENILFPASEFPEEKIEVPKSPKNSKEKSSAKKESTEPEKPKAKIFFFKQAMIDYGFNPGLIDHFILVRKKKRLVNTEVAFNIFIREVEKTGKDKNEVFEIIVKKQWGGFEASWYKKLENEQSSSKTNNGTFSGGKQNDKINGRSNQFTVDDFTDPSGDT